MSGGGRCNFTNMDIDADNYISHNPHFCKSALSRYTQWDFIALVNDYQIRYHERDLGKLFCDDSAKEILDMLLAECKKVKVSIQLNHTIKDIAKTNNKIFTVETSSGVFTAASLVIACGGLSIPKMCASPLGYKIAEQFGHHIWPTSAGLVPFTLQPHDKEKLEKLSGISVASNVSNERIQFKENILFTHRALSGPAILQISSYWQAGENIDINLLPDVDLVELIKARQATQANIKLKTLLSELLAKRLLAALFDDATLNKPLQELSLARIKDIASQLQQWKIKPNGTEGYRTAEVTLGGVDCNELSSKTMQSNKMSGLYFIGEVVDITGWLGGYNFQWAWSSGWSAGQVV
ncbi:MAG: NAD(P)/FAD-dependent oxidoreductase [Gammaproteobacteria bacterium]|nr:NAD(P)/FAD-dependent oxidoreductase [Gammaproteobacteria bacterium]